MLRACSTRLLSVMTWSTTFSRSARTGCGGGSLRRRWRPAPAGGFLTWPPGRGRRRARSPRPVRIALHVRFRFACCRGARAVRASGACVAGGRRRGGPAPGPVRFAAGDALRLPFRDRAFDAVTISFGLRNVADPDAALAEMLRVTRPGGRLVICEFGHLPVARLDAW